MRKVRGDIFWRCRDCGQSFELHTGYLSRFKMDRSFLERAVAVEQHECKPPWRT